MEGTHTKFEGLWVASCLRFQFWYSPPRWTLELFLVDSAGSSIAAYYGRCLDTRKQNRTNITHLDVDVDRNVVQVQFTGGTHKYLYGGDTGRPSL